MWCVIPGRSGWASPCPGATRTWSLWSRRTGLESTRHRAARVVLVGLLGMQERAALLDGQLTIEAGFARGTHFQLPIPLTALESSTSPQDEKDSS
jgi:signal transduction histidine kinase